LYTAVVVLGIACCLAVAIGVVALVVLAVLLGKPLLLAPPVMMLAFVVTQLGRLRWLSQGEPARPVVVVALPLSTSSHDDR
jgi:hypothetical protein